MIHLYGTWLEWLSMAPLRDYLREVTKASFVEFFLDMFPCNRIFHLFGIAVGGMQWSFHQRNVKSVDFKSVGFS